MLDQFEGLSLDMEDIAAQIEEETLMPAELVTSQWSTVSGTDRETGDSYVNNVWEMQWKRLDRVVTTSDGSEFLYRVRHSMPKAGEDVTNRRNRSYVIQADCFGKLGLKGKRPEDFLGAKHWIRESQIGTGQYAKIWFKSEAIYIEGQSFEEAMGRSSAVSNLNPPSAAIPESNESSATEPVSMDSDSPYTKFLEVINGLTHREAITAVENDEILSVNSEILNATKSGQLFDDLEKQGLIQEVDNKYMVVAQD